jgi:hypothetical protein
MFNFGLDKFGSRDAECGINLISDFGPSAPCNNSHHSGVKKQVCIIRKHFWR